MKLKYEQHFRHFEERYTLEDGDTEEGVWELLLEVINELPARCQAAIKLRLLEHLSNGEIAGG